MIVGSVESRGEDAAAGRAWTSLVSFDPSKLPWRA